MILISFVLLAASMQAPQSVEKPKLAKAHKEKKICRRDVATGSIMPMRTCRTAEEWSAIDKVNAGGVEAYHNRPTRPVDTGSQQL